LLILDGWAVNPSDYGNAIAQGDCPTWRSLLAEYPNTLIKTDGRLVGLIDGQMGNSEVGHLNIGAGRIVKQDLLAINDMMESGEFYRHPALCEFIDRVVARGGTLHIMGLVSDGGVHSHQEQMQTLIKLAVMRKVPRIRAHCMLDGRDTQPGSAVKFLQLLERYFGTHPDARIATIMGRYWGMDRDNRWERTERAWRAMVMGEGLRDIGSIQAFRKAWERGETDEFVQPTVILDETGLPAGRIKSGDGIIAFNFRSDRMREITRALTQKDFSRFERPVFPDIDYFSFVQYDSEFSNPVLLPKITVGNHITEYLTDMGLTVLKVAETEKYAHVTYFFNGGREEPYPGEARVLVPSPKVATYDLKPEMSIYQITDELRFRIKRKEFDFYVCNFANGDMVGHTGVFEAALQAVGHVDKCLAMVLSACMESDTTLIVTADHGNCDEMLDAEGNVLTQHSKFPVAVIAITPEGAPRPEFVREDGRALCDLAPTILELMQIAVPKEMTGVSLTKHKHSAAGGGS
jgi:2,3-bisphosphoglycerate-independent phosphoglycerate mutase